MLKMTTRLLGPAILASSIVALVGCEGGTHVELAKTDVKYELKTEGKKREDLPKEQRPPAKGTSYGMDHDPSKPRSGGPPP